MYCKHGRYLKENCSDCMNEKETEFIQALSNIQASKFNKKQKREIKRLKNE